MQVQLSHLDTPCLHINAEAMERNLQEMAHVAADAGVALRPHVKTHKSPSLALRQLEYGAQGLTVAKIGEADVMADATASMPPAGSRSWASPARRGYPSCSRSIPVLTALG